MNISGHVYVVDDDHSIRTSLSRMLRELGYSVQGLLNKDIAVQLGITDATIKVHKARVMEKMRVDSLQGLVKSYLKASLDQSLPTQ